MRGPWVCAASMLGGGARLYAAECGCEPGHDGSFRVENHRRGNFLKIVLASDCQLLYCTFSQLNGVLAQLVRAPACHVGGREFKSRTSRHLFQQHMHQWGVSSVG